MKVPLLKLDTGQAVAAGCMFSFIPTLRPAGISCRYYRRPGFSRTHCRIRSSLVTSPCAFFRLMCANCRRHSDLASSSVFASAATWPKFWITIARPMKATPLTMCGKFASHGTRAVLSCFQSVWRVASSSYDERHILSRRVDALTERRLSNTAHFNWPASSVSSPSTAGRKPIVRGRNAGFADRVTLELRSGAPMSALGH
jgi:hypothetical protein